MKSPGSGRQQKKTTMKTFIGLILVLLLIVSMGTALASSGGEGGGTKGWIATDTYRVMNFVVLAGLLFLVLRKPIPLALNGRIKAIKDQLEDLESEKAEAEKKLAEYNQKLGEIEKEAEKIVADYIQQGKEAKTRILKEAELAAEKLQSQASRNIEHEFEQAQAKLKSEILEKALREAEEIIKNKISTDDQGRLVDEYLEKVVA